MAQPTYSFCTVVWFCIFAKTFEGELWVESDCVVHATNENSGGVLSRLIPSLLDWLSPAWYLVEPAYPIAF